LTPRFSSIRPFFDEISQSASKQAGEIYRSARKRPGLTIGSAATAVAAAGLGIGLSAGSSPAASAAAAGTPAAVHAAAQAHEVASAASNTTASAQSAHGTPHTVPAAATHRAAVTVHSASAAAGPSRQAGTAHSATASPAHRGTTRTVAAASHRAAPAAARHAAAQPAAAPKPYLIYDSVTPGAIPQHHEVATYATGPFAVPYSQVAHRHVMWIDTNGSDPRAGALDIEPGDATPSVAAAWTRQKLSADPHAVAVLYTMQSEWPSVQAAVGQLPAWMQHHVRWWIADPTGYPHVVPGANATQWYWGQNYDITTANPGF
jgi:hypothetical protein